MEIVVNNITPTFMETMDPFYYVNKQQISTIKMGTSQVIKENKPLMHTFSKK